MGTIHTVTQGETLGGPARDQRTLSERLHPGADPQLLSPRRWKLPNKRKKDATHTKARDLEAPWRMADDGFTEEERPILSVGGTKQ